MADFGSSFTVILGFNSTSHLPLLQQILFYLLFIFLSSCHKHRYRAQIPEPHFEIFCHVRIIGDRPGGTPFSPPVLANWNWSRIKGETRPSYLESNSFWFFCFFDPAWERHIFCHPAVIFPTSFSYRRRLALYIYIVRSNNRQRKNLQSTRWARASLFHGARSGKE